MVFSIWNYFITRQEEIYIPDLVGILTVESRNLIRRRIDRAVSK